MKKGMIVLLVILIILVLGMGGYLVYDKVLSKEEVKEEKVEDKTGEVKEIENTISKDETKDTSASSMILDGRKCINNKGAEYYLSSNTSINGLNITYYDNSLNVSVEPSLIKNIYNDIQINDAKSYNISLSKRAVDIYLDGFGQSVGYETLFILMEDGTVEFVPLYYAFKNNNFQSYKLDGVENIIKFISVSAGRAGHSVLAQKPDGTFYDISLMLLDTQYYNN